MDIEEMRQEVQEYYNNNICRFGCSDCLLKEFQHCILEATPEEIKEIYDFLVAKGLTRNNGKHLKGYIFDSLVYRYQLARERQVMWEITKEKIEPETARRSYKRDVMRFIEILDEVIGEHD